MEWSETDTAYPNTSKLNFRHLKTVIALKWKIFTPKEEYHPIWSFTGDVIR